LPGWNQSNSGINLPRPRAAGLITIIIAALAFFCGFLRNELVFIFLGAVFLIINVYGFLTVFFTAFCLRKIAQDIRAEFPVRQIRTGEQCELLILQPLRFFALPGILIRYRIMLSTLDGRIAECFFNPRKTPDNAVKSTVPGRGEYLLRSREIYILDAPGFFLRKIKLREDGGRGILAVPDAANERPLSAGGSGGDMKNRSLFSRTDSLTGNRPYIPGDDPRRINWKLYSHGPSFQLYVREGEKVPVPHSRQIILIDTQIDPVLFGIEEGRSEVDCLCENALAIVTANTAVKINESGQTEIRIGWTGGPAQLVFAGFKDIAAGAAPAVDPAAILARPAALPLMSGDVLPAAADSAGIIILAAPRMSTANHALDKFLAALAPDKTIDIFFLCPEYGKNSDEEIKAADACAAFYRQNYHHRVFSISCSAPR